MVDVIETEQKKRREMKIKATFLFANQNWGDAFGSFDGITCAGHKDVPDTSFLCKLMEKRRDKVPNILSSWTNIPRQRKHTFHPNNYNGKLCTCSVHDPLGQWGPSEAIFCHNDNTIRAGGSAATWTAYTVHTYYTAFNTSTAPKKWHTCLSIFLT